MNKLTTKGVITALLLGALGSGIWSIVGEPILNWFIEVFIETAQKLNSGYYNSLHENIGKGLYEESGLLFKNLMLMLLITVYIAMPVAIYYLLNRQKNKMMGNESEVNIITKDPVKTLKIMFFTSIFLSIVFIPSYISMFVVSNYNSEAIVFTERSIDILAPQLDQDNILQLRADFRSIADAEKFYDLYDRLQDIANANDIELPDFDIAR